MECKYLAPITKKRVKANPELNNKYFCLYEISEKMCEMCLEKNCKMVLCAYYPKRTKECPYKISESFRAELNGFIRFLLKN